MKKLIAFLVFTILCLLYIVRVQSDTIKQLRYELSYNYDAYEEYDDTVAFERGYEYGYNEGYNEVLNYFEDYIGSEEFFNDYGFEF